MGIDNWQIVKKQVISIYTHKFSFPLDIFLFNNLFFEFDHTPLHMLQAEYAPRFKEAILRLAELAPAREDFAAPYLHELSRFAEGDAHYETDVLRELLKIAPDHRSALWLLGQKLSASDDPKEQEEGHALQQRAADLGVQLIYPVSNEALKPFKQIP